MICITLFLVIEMYVVNRFILGHTEGSTLTFNYLISKIRININRKVCFAATNKTYLDFQNSIKTESKFTFKLNQKIMNH